MAALVLIHKEKLTRYIGHAIFHGVGVNPQHVHPFGALHPDEHAAFRARPAEIIGESVRQCIDDGRFAGAVEIDDPGQVAVEIAAGNVFGRQGLAVGPGMQIHTLLHQHKPVLNWKRGHTVAQTQTRGENLGKGTDVDHILRRQ